MPGEIAVQIQGLTELKAGFKGLKRRIQRSALKAPLRAGGKVLEAAVAARAPVLNTKKRGGAWMARVGARKRGLIKRSVNTRYSKIATSKGNAGVFVTVIRPGTTRKAIREGGGKRSLAVNAKRRGGFGLLRKDGKRGGTYYPNDPFYFRFLEEGTKHISPRKFRFIGITGGGVAGRNALQPLSDGAAAEIKKLKATP